MRNQHLDSDQKGLKLNMVDIMGKLATHLVAVCLFSFSGFLSAMPVLQSDGSALTGVAVGGELYDVFFGDGVVGEVFDSAEVSTSEWGKLANKVSAAVLDAFRLLSLEDSRIFVQGCSEISLCVAMLPDSVDVRSYTYSDWIEIAFYRPGESPADPAVPVLLNGTINTADRPVVTLMTFAPASSSVPVASSLALATLAMVFFPIGRRHPNKSRYA